jgi:hypothetical protein
MSYVSLLNIISQSVLEVNHSSPSIIFVLMDLEKVCLFKKTDNMMIMLVTIRVVTKHIFHEKYGLIYQYFLHFLNIQFL